MGLIVSIALEPPVVRFLFVILLSARALAVPPLFPSNRNSTAAVAFVLRLEQERCGP